MFNVFSRLSKLVRNLRTIVSEGLSFFANIGRRRLALAAENLFLRKQSALFREREKKALPTTPADRFVFSKLARCRRIQGAMPNLGYKIARSTIAAIWRRHGMEPAPERSRK